MAYLADVRSSKHSFELSSILSFTRQTVISTVGQGKGEDGASWSIVSKSIAQVIQDSSALLPLAMDTKNVVKGKINGMRQHNEF